MKESFHERVERLTNEMECGDFIFCFVHSGTTHYVQIICKDTCNLTDEPYTWKGRKWLLSIHMTDSEIVQTCFAGAKMAMEHELRETFKWRGECIFRPHFDIVALHEISKAGRIEHRGEPE